MRPEILLAIGFFVVGLIFIVFLIVVLSWWKSMRIRKKAPKFDGSLENLNEINYDKEALERRKMRQENGNDKRGTDRNVEERFGRTEERGRSESDEEKIIRITKKIRELRK